MKWLRCFKLINLLLSAYNYMDCMVNTHCNTVSNLRRIERVGFGNGDVQEEGASCGGGQSTHTTHSVQQPHHLLPCCCKSPVTFEIPISNWWATTQVLIIFTSKTFQPGGLCQLLTRSCEQLTKGRIQEWWCPRGSCLLWWTEHTHDTQCDLWPPGQVNPANEYY